MALLDDHNKPAARQHADHSNKGQTSLSLVGTQSSARPAEIAVETIETLERFEELEAAWNELFDRISAPRNAFKSFNWHWHWTKHYFDPRSSTLRIVAAWSGEQLIAVWPLVISRSLGVRQLKWMGTPVSQYGDILLDQDHVGGPLTARLWKYITNHIDVDVISLEKTRADSPVAPLLKSRRAIVTGCVEAPYLDLSSAPNYDEYEKRYSGRTRKNRRRHRRRLGELGSVTFENVEAGEVAGARVNEAIEVKRQWLKSKGLASRAYSDKKFDAFFLDVASSTDRPTGCVVSVLKSEDKPIAYDIGFQTGDNYVAHIGAFHHDFERFSPGSLLTEDFLRASYERGIGTYDLLAPVAEYKMSWADETTGVCDYAVPMNALGYLYARGVIWFLRNAVKKSLEYSPKFVRRMIRPVLSYAGL